MEYHSENKILQDYLSFIPDLKQWTKQTEELQRERFKNTTQPLITIASNNGFEMM